MTTFMSFRPNPLLLPPQITNLSTQPSSNSLSLHHRSYYFGFSNHKPFVHGSVGVVRFGFKPPLSFLDSDSTDGLIQHMFGRVEGLLYTIADAALTVSDSTTDVSKQKGDWLSGVTNLMESVLKVLNDGISTLHVPYAYGFAIILLTVLVKAATFPLTKKQVESAMAMRSLQPQIKAIQQQYAGDPEKIQLETARLYKLAGVNPLAGCLPTLATIPIWIGLYRALTNVADEGLLTEGFFWIPSLAGPTSIAARQNGSGISWLFPFVDGHPPLGWSDTFAYLVLPVLLVVSQYVSVQIMQASQANDPNMKSSQVLTKFLPLMIGYFALSVPSGLSLYWLTNNILSTTQQIWLQKLGGAKDIVKQFSEESIKVEKQKIAKPVLEVDSIKPVESKQRDQLTSEGPRPGERFRQLKEQEARRKKQKEEENKKVQEIVNRKGKDEEIDTKELNVVITKDETNEAKFVDAGDQRLQAMSVKHDSSKTEVLRVNDDNSSHNSTEIGLNGNSGADGKGDQPTSNNLGKEEIEVRTNATTTMNVVSGKEEEEDRIDQQPSRSDKA